MDHKLSPDNETSLVCIYHPQQILPALAALDCYRRHHKIDLHSKVNLFLFNKSVAEDKGGDVLEVIKNIIKARPCVVLDIASIDDIKFFSKGFNNILLRAKYLKFIFQKYKFSEIFFSHDISSDFLSQAFMRAFPYAEFICFGDSYGTVYTHRYFENIFYPVISLLKSRTTFRAAIKNFLLRVRRWSILLGGYQYAEAKYAILIMPSDPGGDFLKNKILMVPAKKDVLELAEECKCKIKKLTSQYESFGQIKADAKQILLLMGNYHETKMMSLSQELALYYEVTSKYANKDYSIIAKAHPSSNANKIISLSNMLKEGFVKFEVIQPASLPIELIFNQEDKIPIISLSYSSVVLKYMYKLNIVHMLDDYLIDKFFKKEFKCWAKINNDLYLDQLNFFEN
jgi:hypothetical protein